MRKNKNVTSGPYREKIILGKELAHKLGVQMDDTVSMVAPASHLTPMGLVPKIKLYKVVGLFESGMFEYDSSLAFVSIDGMYRAMGFEGRDSGKPQMCDACFTGDYPITLTDHLDGEETTQLSLLDEASEK